MNKPLFTTGDTVRFGLDGMQYQVLHVTNERGNEPGERMYTLVIRGRWPWQSIKVFTLPETLAGQHLQKVIEA